MTHFVRYAVIGAIVAGASVYTFAQDDLDALLGDLILDDVVAEEATLEEDILAEEETPIIEDVIADVEEAAEEAVAEVEAPVEEDVVVADEEETPAIDEVIAEVEETPAEDVVAEVEAPVEEDVVVAEEETPAIDEVIAEVEETPAEDVVAEVEAPVEEDVVVAEEETPAIDEVIAEVEETPAEDVVAEVEAPVEEDVVVVEEETPVVDEAIAEVEETPAEDVVADVEAPVEEDVAVAEDETPAVDEAIAEVEETPAEDVVADVEAPVEEDVVVAEEETPAIDEVIAEVEETPAEDVVAEVEAPVEEDVAVAEDETPAVDEAIAEVEETPAEDVVADVEAPAEEDVTVAEEETPAVDEAIAEVEETPAEDVVADVEAPAEEDVAVAEEDIASIEVPVDENAIAEDAVAEDPKSAPETPAAEALLADVATEPEAIEELTEEERNYNELDALLRMTNEGYDRYAQECYDKAIAMMKQTPSSIEAVAHYQKAKEKFEEAKKTIRHREKSITMNANCDKYILDAEYCMARAFYKNKEYAKAKELATSLEKDGYPKAAALITAIDEEVQTYIPPVAESILPEYAKDEHKMERLAVADRLKRATIYYQLSKYSEASNQIDLVLRDDPNNLEAIALRKRLQLRHADRNRALKMSQRAKMISDVEGNWTPVNSLGVESEEFIVPEATTTAKTPVDEKGARDAEVIRNKLETIRLPEFSIAPPSTIADAVPLFAELAKLYDKPDLPPEERGISFVLNAASKPKPAPVADEEGDAWASESTDSDDGLKTLPPINLTYVTLKDALDMVCEVSGFTYTIKGRTVLLVPPGTVSKDEFQTRKYNVMPDAIAKLVQASSEMAAGTGGGGGDEGDWGGMDASSGFADSMGGSYSPDLLKQTFQGLGVPFADDAKIFYLSTVGKLHVTNTPENLALVENILEEYNITPYLIEVEARFVEVSQSDLNSLGFEWRLNGDLLGTVGDGIDWASSAFTGSGKTTAGGTNGQGARVFRGFGPDGTGSNNLAIHGGANAFNQGTRFLGDSGLYANRVNLTGSMLPVDDTFLSFSAVFGELDMTMILHMLAQRSDTDMLSSPKVIAKQEEEALIRVVTEWIYPTEFEIQELDNDDNNNNWNNDNNGGGGQIANQPPPVKFAVEPSSFEKQEVGVKLQVIPRVLPEGQMIELAVEPTVVEYLGDFEYGMQIPYVKGVTESLLAGTTENEIGYYQVSMPQPKFHFREIRTKLSIYNGATIVLGGLITETRKSFEDKVPFFGDLPFIGFLFRSSGEYSEKRNLLIFISARLVDPAGRPIKAATDGRLGANAATTGATTMGAIEE